MRVLHLSGKIKFAIFLALIGGVFAAAGESGNENGTTGNTQTYTPARYAIIGAEIDVSLQQGGIANFRRRVILKFDTQTGKTSVLQLAQLGIGNPTVTSAVWAPVAETGSFIIDNNLQINGL